VYDENTQELDSLDNSASKNKVNGAGAAMAQKIFELKPDMLSPEIIK
jgi:hypothetical protein